uniref:Uncharacterized protein n=1 Tax=Rhizophora mucronata TaxID=61149 RepID=A0A2P2PQI7_RHIMU
MPKPINCDVLTIFCEVYKLL